MPAYKESGLTTKQSEHVTKNPFYDLEELPTAKLREEFRRYIEHRSKEVCNVTLYRERSYYKIICRFLNKYKRLTDSLTGVDKKVIMHRFKGWMFQEGMPLVEINNGVYGVITTRARPIAYLERLIDFMNPEQEIPEIEKDIWELEKLDIPYKNNPIKNAKTLNFTKIFQPKIREELKKGIYLNLQGEAIACVQKEMTAMRRLSKYLKERQPQVQSFKDIDRNIIEEYLTYLKTESVETKHFHADLNRLRAALDSIGEVCGYDNLNGLFLTRDIPPTPKAEFRTYSDGELKRLNAAIVRMDEQTARLMIIHQMLGTRISDTLTLETDCLIERGVDIIIRIRQMKTGAYEKPVSEELATLIRKAISYTKEKYGKTAYIFVNDKSPEKPLQYGTIQTRILRMIKYQDIRDDNGNLFGFGSHLYRHYYGMKLTEMHLDDWTIAKLLGHSNVKNVKYYRRMSNQLLADDTRHARNILSDIMLSNLDGWEKEYEEIRQDGSL